MAGRKSAYKYRSKMIAETHDFDGFYYLFAQLDARAMESDARAGSQRKNLIFLANPPPGVTFAVLNKVHGKS